MHTKTIVFGVFASVVLFFCATAQTKAALPSGFNDQLLTSGLNQPTDFAFTPDGRIFITEQNGQIAVYKNNALLSTPAISLNVGTGGDRGLLSITFDQNFSTNHYVYLLYTSSAFHERISRFTVNGDLIDPATENILLENSSVWSGFLNAGALRFGPDGKLYATLGSNGSGTGAQDLSNLDGKFIRINSDGTIPSDNPFFNTPGAQKAIYSYGLRNPWRFNFDPVNGNAIIGDVGEDLYEKLVRAAPGANFGWPNFEGDCTQSPSGCNGVTPPLYTYPHNGQGAAIVGGVVYTKTNFPSQYLNSYFFGDYVRGFIKNITFANDGHLQSVSDFATNEGSIADLVMTPDGCLAYLTIFPGNLREICYSPGVNPVTAKASSNTNYGNLPLTINFDSSTSTGDNLSYFWNFGDGSTSNQANPSHTYTTKGIYTTTLTVSNSTGSSQANLTIWAGYLPPSANITSPGAGTTYSGGQIIPFSGTANDPQDGTLPDSAYRWRVIFHHNTHIHPPTEYVGVKSGNFTTSTDLHTLTTDVWYEFELTVTDGIGLSTVVSRSIYPNLVNFELKSNPPGLQITVDGQPITTPFVTQAIPGLIWNVDVPSPQNLNGTSYAFASWSDQNPKAHAFVMPTNDNTLTASFNTSGTVPLSFTDSISLNNNSPKTGDNITLTSTVMANQNLTGALIDTEIYDASNNKVLQNFKNTDLTANQNFVSNWSFSAPGPGNYKIKIGVFKNDWSFLYYWDDAAGSMTVSPAQTTAFVVNASMPTNTFPANSPTTITTNITSTTSIDGVAIDTEIYDANSQKIGQKVVATNLVSNQEFSNVWNLTTPPSEGLYTVKIGVFSSDWSKLYFWKNNAFQFHVGTPPGPPQPGTNYNVKVIYPTDNGSVSGVQEVKAVIDGLDINTHNIGWRTGTGALFNLDTDPITMAYKHAWIDFGPWTWKSDNIYPLEFQARDQSGNTIGDSLIHVQVVH